MSNSATEPNDCDVVALTAQNDAYTGTAHVKEITIQTQLPDPLVFPKRSVAYIHFKNLPHQPVDYVQLTDGGSASGEILEPTEIEFTIAENGQKVTLPRDIILALIFRCSIAAASEKP